MSALLQRFDSGDQGTFGVLSFNGISLYSGELPWRDNTPNKSCIPAGTYQVIWAKSPRLQKYTYRLIGVEGRGGILIHSANLFGDRQRGYKAQLLGCISLGEKIGWLDGQKAILISRPAIRTLEEFMQRKPFTLEVKDV